MSIPPHQVQNILRVYNRQLRLERVKPHDKERERNVQLPMDEVSISDEGKKKQIFKAVSSQVVQQVTSQTSKAEGVVSNGQEEPDEIDEKQAERPGREGDVGT
ncbi:MAG: DVU0524 family FlgM-associated protein [Pseudomonadota bacterium]